MLVRILEKYRDGRNKIVGFRIMYEDGYKEDIEAEDLIQSVKNNRMTLVNAYLSESGKVVTNKPVNIVRVV